MHIDTHSMHLSIGELACLRVAVRHIWPPALPPATGQHLIFFGAYRLGEGSTVRMLPDALLRRILVPYVPRVIMYIDII